MTELSLIVNYYKNLPVLLKSLPAAQESLKGIDSEILIVESQADPKTKYLLKKKFPQVKYIGFKENIGYAKSVNRGVRYTKGSFILVINADIILHRNCPSLMLRYLKDHPDVGLLGPRVLDEEGELQYSCFRFYKSIFTILARRTIWGRTPWGRKREENFLMKDWSHRTSREVDWLKGCCFMSRREYLQRVGGLDERFFMYFEDVDLARRFWEEGLKVVFYPEALVQEIGKGASRRRWKGVLGIVFSRYTRIHILSWLKYLWKYKFKELPNGR